MPEGLTLKKSTANKTKTCHTFILNKDKHAHMKEILKEHRILNIYMMNILGNIIFMHRLDNTTAHYTFLTKFCKPSHAHQHFHYHLKLKRNKYKSTETDSLILLSRLRALN